MGAFQSLDPPTLQLSIAVFSGLLAVLSIVLARVMPDNRVELRRWACSMLCSAMAFSCYFMRGHAPAWLTLVVANLAVLGTPAFGLLAHAHFRRTRVPTSFVLATAVVGWAGPWATLVLGAPMWIAVVSMSLASSVLGLLTTAVIWRTPRGPCCAGTFLSCAAFAGLGGILAARAVLVAVGPDTLPMHSNAAPQLVTLFVGCLFVVCGTLGLMLMVVEGQRQHALEHARRDTLTGALTRGAFTQGARHQLQAGRALAMLMIDIDHFKNVNDQHGHAAGDSVLVHAARLIAGRCRSTDLVGRYGGEEFCALMLDCSEAAAGDLAERLVQDIRNATVRLGGNECRYTISVGYAASPGNTSPEALPALPLETLFERADRALYAAKRGGRDRAVASSTLLGDDPRHAQWCREALRDGRTLATPDIARA